jgi:predicted XRE-type DNA-binding protein
MTFNKETFMEEKQREAEHELGHPIAPEDWRSGSVFSTAGNVFEAMRLAGENERHLKVQLAFLIKRTIKTLELKQEKVADLTGLSQPDVSKIVRAQLKGFSPFKLLEVLMRLGGNVQMTVEMPKHAPTTDEPAPAGKLSLVAM